MLTGMLICTYVQTNEPVYAAAMSRGGNYIVAAGHLNQSLDVVYVINLAVAKLNVYFVDRDGGYTLKLVETRNLENVFAQG
ncbi:MAG: hypothetical protein KAX78_12105 [Phycisphaerae bacterium]|nr:hypothetical protein [Phycisphaerae bacterium]